MLEDEARLTRAGRAQLKRMTVAEEVNAMVKRPGVHQVEVVTIGKKIIVRRSRAIRGA